MADVHEVLEAISTNPSFSDWQKRARTCR